MVTGVGAPIHRLSRKTTEDTETLQKTQKFFSLRPLRFSAPLRYPWRPLRFLAPLASLRSSASLFPLRPLCPWRPWRAYPQIDTDLHRLNG